MADELYYMRVRGKISGPFDIASLQKLVRRGALSRIHEISGDRATWNAAGQYDDLFPNAGVATEPIEPAVEEHLDDFNGIQAAESPPTSAPAEQRHKCISCGGLFPIDGVFSEDGLTTCKRCFATRAVPPAYASQPSRCCPACGSTQSAVRRAKGSTVLAIVLLLLWILPGVLYLIFCSGHASFCPHCGFKYGDTA
jgi:hypothetical protein